MAEMLVLLTGQAAGNERNPQHYAPHPESIAMYLQLLSLMKLIGKSPAHHGFILLALGLRQFYDFRVQFPTGSLTSDRCRGGRWWAWDRVVVLRHTSNIDAQ
eukprot:3667410-Amphidinium_carterae.1